MSEFLFTSESVSEGHPDKVADQISDAVLDAILSQDPAARVAAETLVNTGLCVLAGEVSTSAHINYIQVARETIKRIGYNSSEMGFDADGCAVMVCYDEQSPDIAQGVNEGEGVDLDMGAGDQGLMFGYACDETPTLMPFAIYYAHRLMQRQSEVRKSGLLPWLRPDAKAQLTCVYDAESGKVKRIDTVVLSTQHTVDDACLCRKPAPGLLEQICDRYRLDPRSAVLISGCALQLQAGAALGMALHWVGSHETAPALPHGTQCHGDLAALAAQLLAPAASV